MILEHVASVRFTLLGPMEVFVDDRPIKLGGRGQRSVLMMLLLARGQPVPIERLVDAVWGGAPPRSADATLHVYVARLRKLLGPARNSLRTSSQGYLLATAGVTVDAWHFDDTLNEALAAAAAGHSEQVRSLLEPVLRRWNETRVFGSMRDEPWAILHANRLEERRLVAIETLADVELALNNHGSALLRLEEVVPHYPHREGLNRNLMLALYRSGRQADALAIYDRCRKSLRRELGIEPSLELQKMQQAILGQSPDLILQAGTVWSEA